MTGLYRLQMGGVCFARAQVFLTQEYNAYGRYKLRLYNGEKKKWQIVVVDDYIPCR